MRYIPKIGDFLLNEISGETILIGDININGGTCDDCFNAPWSNGLYEEDKLSYELKPYWTLKENILDAKH